MRDGVELADRYSDENGGNLPGISSQKPAESLVSAPAGVPHYVAAEDKRRLITTTQTTLAARGLCTCVGQPVLSMGQLADLAEKLLGLG